jgi:hypothetical protein
MNRVAIAFSTCDRVELSRQSIEPLLQSDKFDLYAIDGSKTPEGKKLAETWYGQQVKFEVRRDVTGGSGAAIVYALSHLLEAPCYGHPPNKSLNPGWYDYIGLVENDVVLPHDWFAKTMALFEQGEADGLKVGCVSTRCYEDRILFSRDGYAVMHNLGAGQIIFTREAAELILCEYRVQWTTENRKAFSLVAGIDIGSYWAFKGMEHFLVADFRWDALLAQHGLASLALTPSPVQMIGQVPPLKEQGLRIVTDPFHPLVARDLPDRYFKTYRDNLHNIRLGNWKLPDTLFHRDSNGGYTIFAHQIGAIGGHYQGKWKLKDAPGFGPFGWIADSEQEDFDPRIFIPIAGPCEVMVSGGSVGGQIEIVDEQSGFNARPILPTESGAGTIVSINLPGNVAYRTIRINMMTPGCVFYGIRTHNEQPRVTNWKFDWNTLPHGRVEL